MEKSKHLLVICAAFYFLLANFIWGLLTLLDCYLISECWAYNGITLSGAATYFVVVIFPALWLAGKSLEN